MRMPSTESPNPPDWLAALRADASEVALRRRWGVALVAVGWVHLVAFLACHAIRNPAIRSDPRHAGLWALDVAGCLLAMRVVSGRDWYRASPAAALVARLWGTFLVLAFSLAVLNSASGWSHDWFKPTWCTLSSFGFAAMAWLFDARFLIPAVQMGATGLVMVRYPSWNYVIFGISWWAALQGIGIALARSAQRPGDFLGDSRRARESAA